MHVPKQKNSFNPKKHELALPDCISSDRALHLFGAICLESVLGSGWGDRGGPEAMTQAALSRWGLALAASTYCTSPRPRMRTFPRFPFRSLLPSPYHILFIYYLYSYF